MKKTIKSVAIALLGLGTILPLGSCGPKPSMSSPSSASTSSTNVTKIVAQIDAVKTSFDYGEAFSSDRFQVLATFKDGTEDFLGVDKLIIDSSSYKASTAGKYTIKVSLKEDPSITSSYEVTVKEKVLKILRISVKTPPKVDYAIGEELDVAGLVVTGINENEVEVALSLLDYEIIYREYNKTVAGTYTIKIVLDSNAEVYTSYTVTVK